MWGLWGLCRRMRFHPPRDSGDLRGEYRVSGLGRPRRESPRARGCVVVDCSTPHRDCRLDCVYVLSPQGEPSAMSNVRQSTTRDDRDLPSLPKRVKRRNVRLVLATVVTSAVLAVILDSYRVPSAQLGSHVYIKAVRVYQGALRPWLQGYVCCRFRPSCSEYSIEAVQTHGLWRGLGLTTSRIFNCRRNVPFGTYDPVPPASNQRGIAIGYPPDATALNRESGSQPGRQAIRMEQ